MITFRQTLYRPIIIGLSVLLVACGGGGGSNGSNDSSDNPVNQSPVVSAPDTSIASGSSGEITASASDPDGSITKYSWVQKSGVSLTLENTDQRTVSITAPDVTENAQALISVTVTDNEGATASADVTVQVTAPGPQGEGFTIGGKVTDNPVANAEVRVLIGSETFQTTADAAGVYELFIDTSSFTGDEIVHAIATAPESNPQLKLVSVMNTVSELEQAAGTDKLLVAQEYFGVNITNVSTALSAMLEKENGGPISSATQLLQARASIHGDIALELATAIKLVLDYSANTTLAMPGGYTDSYAFASDTDAVSDYLAKAKRTASTDYNAAREAIFADPDLVLAAPRETVTSIADTYFFSSPYAVTASPLLGYKLELLTDGTGRLIGRDHGTDLTWTATAEGVFLEGARMVVRKDSVWNSELGQQVERQEIIQLNRIRWLARDLHSDVLLVDVENYFTYPGGEAPDSESSVSIKASSTIKSASRVAAADLLELGMAYSMPHPTHEGEVVDPKAGANTTLEFRASEMVFSGSTATGGSATISVPSITGAGVPLTTDISAAWSIGSSGELLLEYPDGGTAEYVFLSEQAGKVPMVHVVAREGGIPRSIFGQAQLKEAPAWTAASAPGIYTLGSNFFAPNEHFWFEINSDGSALTVSAGDWDENGTVEDHEFLLMPGLWQIGTSGNLLIRRYRVPGGGEYCAPESWDPADDAPCVLQHEREWSLQLTGANRYWIRHYHRYFEDPWRSDLYEPTVTGHISASNTIDNRRLLKLVERPMAIPAHLL